MGEGSPQKFNCHEKFNTTYIYSRGKMPCEEDVEYKKKLCVHDRPKQFSRQLCSHSRKGQDNLGSGRPVMGHRYFQSAIDEVQARGRHAIAIIMWLIFPQYRFLWV